MGNKKSGIPQIAVIGEYYKDFDPHTSLCNTLDHLKKEYNFDYLWVETREVEAKRDTLLQNFSGVWSAPGSPFKSLDGSLYAIKYARENKIPHIGTCAGFQHAIIELARNVLGFENAGHEEYDDDSLELFINRLDCSLAGKTMEVDLVIDSKVFSLYGKEKVMEKYYCNFGINPDFKQNLNHPLIKISGVDSEKEIRIIEFKNHPFFIITLFVPQISSTPENPHPLIKGFVKAVLDF